ncbi:MAG TPA: amidohydrolase family protein [Burkholderiaceae bacterium]|nr:amidohydrolase family protein [Burkholderiaceae bacterium]
MNEHDEHDAGAAAGLSRRGFLKSGSAAGLAAGAAIAGASLLGAGSAEATAKGYRTAAVGANRSQRILLKGGIVLTLDKKVGDFEKADVLIEGKKILAIGPNLKAEAQVIDCTGTIVMPGFISTHQHQYQVLLRSMLADGIHIRAIPADAEQPKAEWPGEFYTTVVQGIWSPGRLPEPPVPGQQPVWDLGRSPMEPEDCYLAELVSCLSQITQGVTTVTDTSQSSHTPEHTDAMIQALFDSGQRAVYAYGWGINRSAQFPQQRYEYPGRSGDTSSGLGRLAKQYFSSKDQLVTLGTMADWNSVVDAKTGDKQKYTGWQLAREFGAWINNHAAHGAVVRAIATDPRNGTDWSDVTLVHCTQWQDEAVAQIGANNVKSAAWQLLADRGGHASIAPLIEMQMRHGMPPFQLALNHGILPSLSPDIEANMTANPFSLMRSAFTLQRGLANDLVFPLSSDPNSLSVPQLVTTRQVIEMMTIAGAAGSGLQHKVGTLTPGKEADIVVLDANTINIAPMNNVPGTVVTMMESRNVRDVLIAGKIVYRNGNLVGWDVPKLVRDLTRARDRVLARINGPALVGKLPPGLNSQSDPYRPNFLGSCCYNGQNNTAPHYVLRP